MDSFKNYRTDYLYSRKSVPRGILGTLYVWCCYQLLHSYQKLLIGFCMILFLSFPAFAEDEKYSFHDIGNEALYLNDQPLKDNIATNGNFLGGFNNGLKTINLGDSVLTRVSTYSSSDGFRLRAHGSGYAFSNYNSATGIITEERGFIPRNSTINDNYFNTTLVFPIGTTLTVTGVVFANEDGTTSTTRMHYQFNNSNQSIDVTEGSFMTDYLAQVTTVFTWLLTSITSLITFILGNPFLAVSLVLFMCGAVVSFYVRIKNS